MNKKITVFKDIFSVLIASICLLSMYLLPETVKSSVFKSLQLCGGTLIPSLYPFIVGTRICAELIMRIPKTGTHKRFRHLNISPSGLIILFLGLISGFPNGASLAGSAYKSGSISADEATRITAFSNCISPSFCIIVFGDEVMKSKLLGAIVFSAVICSNILMFFVTNTGQPKKEKYQNMRNFVPTSITAIISDSLFIVLNICAYVTVFGCFSALVEKICTSLFCLPKEIILYISPILEISGGILKLSVLPFFKRLIAGSLLLSFGGLSAVMQVHNVCIKFGLSFSAYIKNKLVSSLITPILTVIFAFFVQDPMQGGKNPSDFFSSLMKHIFNLLILIIALKLLYMMLKRIFSRKNIKKAN